MTHGGSSNGHADSGDLDEDGPEAKLEGREAEGETVGELAGTQGEVGATDGPGSGIKVNPVSGWDEGLLKENESGGQGVGRSRPGCPRLATTGCLCLNGLLVL